MTGFQRYTGGEKHDHGYLASARLVTAVNTALALRIPLLVTGDPGTGKTALAKSIADELGLGDVLEFHTRSDSQRNDVLYRYDALKRFYEANRKSGATDDELKHHVHYVALGQAIKDGKDGRERVVLIDEIDKAPRDFPNDLLNIVDKQKFRVDETGEEWTASVRPIVIITSNGERELPEPFLRRSAYFHIEFPDEKLLLRILKARLKRELKDPEPIEKILGLCVQRFMELRTALKSEGARPPATAELILWLRMLELAGFDARVLESAPLHELPHSEVLIKNHRTAERLKTRAI